MQKKEYSQIHRGIVISMMLLLLGFSFTSIPLWYVPTQGAHNNEINIDSSIFDTAGHVPWPVIAIDGDADLASQGWLGDGSSDTPYRIENLNISTASSVERITIRNTRAHFLIKNCTLIGMTGSDYAIQLVNVSNGVITDNDISGNPSSIEVINSTYVTVINNTCSQSSRAISIRSNTDPTNNIQILNNTLTGGTNAIRGYKNHELTIAENKLSSITDTGIYIYNSESVSITDNELDDTGHYGLYLDYTLLDSEIFGNTIEDCDEGIYLEGSSSMVIANNSVSLCTNGINFDYADNNFLENNSVSGCSIGLILDVGSGGNDIIWNFYEGNTVQVTDSGPGNTIRNNYYSDHSGLDANSDGIVDTSYPLAGISSNNDPYPLMNKFVARLGLDWNPVPTHQFYEVGESFSYDLNTTSTIGIDWQLTGSSYHAIDSSGIITNTSSAVMVSYEMHVVATNYHARSIDAYFNITSQDTIDPVWVAQPEDEYFWDQGQTFAVRLEADDAAIDVGMIGTWWINNTLNFEINDGMDGTCDIYGNAILAVLGTYNLEVRYTDQADHYVSASFKVIYRDNTNPMFTLAPYPLTFTEGYEQPVFLTWIFSDLNLYSYELKIDGITAGFSYISESPYTYTNEINVAAMSVGIHIVTLTITDIGGNSNTQEVEITIEQELTTETTTTTPPDLTNLIIIGGYGAIVLVIVIIVVMKKRS